MKKIFIGLVIIGVILGLIFFRKNNLKFKNITIGQQTFNVAIHILSPPFHIKDRVPQTKDKIPDWFDAFTHADLRFCSSFNEFKKYVTPEWLVFAKETETAFNQKKQKSKGTPLPDDTRTIFYEAYWKKPNGEILCGVASFDGSLLNKFPDDINDLYFNFYLKRDGKWYAHAGEDVNQFTKLFPIHDLKRFQAIVESGKAVRSEDGWLTPIK